MTFAQTNSAQWIEYGEDIASIRACVDYCEARGIDMDYARFAGLRALPPDVVRKCVRDAVVGPALLIPYFGIDGKPLLDKKKPYARIRLLSAVGGDKFRQPPSTANHLYFAPLREKDGNWKEIAKEPSRELYIVEGEFKALALAQHGLAAVAIGGIANYMTKGQDDGEQ